MKAEVKFSLHAGECNGYMETTWYANDRIIYSSTADQIPGPEIQAVVDLPCTIRAEFSGKDMMNDTRVDGDKIVADKFVEIKSMSLAKLPVHDHNFVGFVKYTTEDGRELHQKYISWNGSVEIEITEADPLKWHLCYNPVFAD